MPPVQTNLRTAATPPAQRLCRHPGAQERAAMAGDHARCTGQERNPARHISTWPHDLAAVERLPPTKPRRDKDALLQAARRACHGARLRQAGGRATDEGSNPEPLHGPWNTANSARGISPSNIRGSSTSGWFVQQSLDRAVQPLVENRRVFAGTVDQSKTIAERKAVPRLCPRSTLLRRTSPRPCSGLDV